MNSQGMCFILTILAAVPCVCAPIILAFQFGLVFLWWGQDAEAFFGILLLVALVPMIIAAVVAIILFFVIANRAQWLRWLMNGVYAGFFFGVASLVSIEIGGAWPGGLGAYIVISSVATCGLGLVLLLSLNRIVDRLRHA